MPTWVQTGCLEYTKRMPKECKVEILELPAAKRVKTTNTQKIKQEECHTIQKILAKHPHALVVALDERGKPWSTQSLAEDMKQWLGNGTDVMLLIGGPDGLDEKCLEAAAQKRSLSKLTLPHPMVRVLVTEQLYRAWSLLNNHPYHRA